MIRGDHSIQRPTKRRTPRICKEDTELRTYRVASATAAVSQVTDNAIRRALPDGQAPLLVAHYAEDLEPR